MWKTFCMVVFGREYVTTYCWHQGGAYSFLNYQTDFFFCKMWLGHLVVANSDAYYLVSIQASLFFWAYWLVALSICIGLIG